MNISFKSDTQLIKKPETQSKPSPQKAVLIGLTAAKVNAVAYELNSRSLRNKMKDSFTPEQLKELTKGSMVRNIISSVASGLAIGVVVTYGPSIFNKIKNSFNHKEKQ
ncbi:MAG: hypothetical protein WCK67_07395 [bacterium]